MGYLNTANDMVDNSMKLLSDVLDSKFTSFLQGNGTPVLVTYYNIDDTLSTTDIGNYTVDQILGGNSPLRYDKILNFPLVGLKELIPNIEQLDGNLMDLSIDGEVILFPNTIRPSGFDFFVYTYPGGTITFRVNGFEFSSIKSNNYYKLETSLKDINDNDTIDKLELQVIKTFRARLDNVGTQDKCLIEDTIYDEISNIDRLLDTIIEEYTLSFFDSRYNCLVLRDSPFNGYTIYDPYLTTFIENNDILDIKGKYVVIHNFDNRPEVDKMYRKSIYRCLETRNSSHMDVQYMEPTSFGALDLNPFYYYGEETAFTVSLRLPTSYYDFTMRRVVYGDEQLLKSIIYHNYPDKKPISARPSQDGMKDESMKPITNQNPNMELTNVLTPFDLYGREGVLSNIDKPDDATQFWKDRYGDKPLTDEDLEDIYTDDVEDDDYHDIPISGKPEPPEEEPEEELTLNPSYLKFIRDYFVNENMFNLFTPEEIQELFSLDIQNTVTDFIHIPMLIYILRKYKEYLCNNK